MIDEHVTEFAGRAVQDWNEESGIVDPGQYHYRIKMDYDDEGVWTDRLSAFLSDPKVSEVTGLIVGNWGEVASGEDTITDVVEALTAAREQLPKLTALFLGDITYEESEISWIIQGDISPLLSAYPELEHLRVRSGNELRLGTLRHDHLKSLTIESGGLPVNVLREVLSAHLPALEHLELWLGTDRYGWDGSLDDLKPLFEGTLFPKLRYLGLRDSEIADQIAVAIADAPIIQQLDTLDLSLGTLSDEGATALLNSKHVPHLAKLDLHHHYLSEEMMSRLTSIRSERTGDLLDVDVSDRQQARNMDERYVAAGE